MTAWVELLRWIHVLGATVLLGTGAGIAFFMLMVHRTAEPAIIAHVAGTVVIADALFTATAVVVQPITGILLAKAMGWPLATPWIMWSLALYVGTGVCWLPVVDSMAHKKSGASISCGGNAASAFLSATLSDLGAAGHSGVRFCPRHNLADGRAPGALREHD
jgi:uncharacterized membrane protein